MYCPDFDFNHVACTKLISDVLWASKALENAALNHDSHLSWKRLRFFHAVSGEDDRTLLPLSDFCNHFPHKTTGFRIHSCWGLVQEDNRRISNQCHSRAHLALVASRQRAHSLITLCHKTKPLYRFIYNLVSKFHGYSFEARVILDVFIYIHCLEDQIVLRRVANELASLVKVCKQVKSTQTEATYCW